MTTTARQRRRQRLSQSLRQWFGQQQDSKELDANNRQVELRKRRQFQRNKRAS